MEILNYAHQARFTKDAAGSRALRMLKVISSQTGRVGQSLYCVIDSRLANTRLTHSRRAQRRAACSKRIAPWEL
jgi:hypothetical protein